MANSRAFLLSGAILFLTACSGGPPAHVPPYLRPLQCVQADEIIKARQELARKIADAVQDSVLSIQEEPTQTLILLSLDRLKKVTNASYRDGSISIQASDHTFRIYLLLCGACVRSNLDSPGNLLNLRITRNADLNLPGEIVEGGQYRVYMVEDGLVTWAWDLQPAFKDTVLPETGGFDPGEAFLVSETGRRLRECK